MGLPIIPNRFSAHFQPVRPSLPIVPTTIHIHSKWPRKRPESASKQPSNGFKKRLSHSFQTISKRKTSNLQVSPTFFPETTYSTYTVIATHSPTDRKSPLKRSKRTKSEVSSKKHRSRRLKKGRWEPLPVWKYPSLLVRFSNSHSINGSQETSCIKRKGFIMFLSYDTGDHRTYPFYPSNPW